MTKEDWEKVKEAWESPFSIKLKVDDYELSIHMEQYKMKLYRSVYVNGWLKGEWLMKSDNDEYPTEGVRFYQTMTKRFYSAKDIKEHQKIFGKRAANKLKEQKYEYKSHFWKSFNSFKAHLIKHNQNIELIEC